MQIINKSIELGLTSGKVLGYKFYKDGTLYCETKCRLCGKWFQWQATVPEEARIALLAGKLDLRINKPKHCGGSTCEDWQHRRDIYLGQQHEEKEAYYQGLFCNLLEKGLIPR